MCGVQSAWCRLCLASDILPPYLDLRQDDTGQVEELRDCFELKLNEKLVLRHRDQLVYLFEKKLLTDFPGIWNGDYRHELLRRPPYMELMIEAY